MPDYYEQPAYLRDLEPETQTVTITPTDNPSPRRNRLPVYILMALGVLLFLVLILMLVRGTSSNNNNNNQNNNNQNETPTGTTTTIQWWGVFMDKTVIQPLIDEYQAINPNIKIEYANRWPEGKYTDAAKIYRSELNRVLRENDPVQIPDIYMVQNTWAADYELYSKKSDSYDFDTYKSIFYPAVVSDFTNELNKEVYGVPIWFDTYAVIYNKDLLEQAAVSTPPTSWPAFKSLAQTLTVRQGGEIVQSGFPGGITSNTDFASELVNLLALQNGVELVNSEGQPVFAQDPDIVTALSFYKSFSDATSGSWSSSLKNESALFLEGKLAMDIVPSYRYREIQRFNKGFSLGLDIGISQVPQLQGQSQPVINWADYWGNMVAANRPSTQASWAFLRWITQPEQLRKISENEKNYNQVFGFLYPRIDMAQDLQNDADLKIFNESLQFARTWDMVKGLEVKEEFNKLINQGTPSQSAAIQTQTSIQLLINNKGRL